MTSLKLFEKSAKKVTNNEIIAILEKDLKEVEEEYAHICDLDEPRQENYLYGAIDALRKAIYLLKLGGN